MFFWKISNAAKCFNYCHLCKCTILIKLLRFPFRKKILFKKLVIFQIQLIGRIWLCTQCSNDYILSPLKITILLIPVTNTINRRIAKPKIISFSEMSVCFLFTLSNKVKIKTRLNLSEILIVYCYAYNAEFNKRL